MKNCPNCGAPIDPYRVKCDYCGTMYFDWATWMEDGKPCFINYKLGDNTITASAIPRLETVNVYNDLISVSDYFGNTISTRGSASCELNVKFTCLANKDNELFRIVCP